MAASAFVAALFGCSTEAKADETAPELETTSLRRRAEIALRRVVAVLDAPDRRRLTGVYVAFDDDAADPSTMAACDDDGDYVVVITDAMLRLARTLAAAQTDGDDSARAESDYAAFLARAQVPGRRLLPPPAGFFDGRAASTSREEILDEALAFLVARELTHLRAGDLVCPRPTATREQGDDVWTAAEQRRALEVAASLYATGHAASRDTEAATRVLASGQTMRGATALLRFFARLEVERATHASRFSPRYLTQHPSSATRMASIRAAEVHAASDR